MAERNVNAPTTDTARGRDACHQEPNDGTGQVVPEKAVIIFVVRLVNVAGLKEPSVETNLRPGVGGAKAITIETVRDLDPSTIGAEKGRSRRAFVTAAGLHGRHEKTEHGSNGKQKQSGTE